MPPRRVRADSIPFTLYSPAPTALTDSTGGTVSSTLAAGITDPVMKNAVATIAAQISALTATLKNAGLLA